MRVARDSRRPAGCKAGGGASRPTSSRCVMLGAMKTTPRSFNIAGPCDESRHYLIDPISRLPDARGLIDEGGYFVVHGPRQTGKTTSLRALAKALTADGQYAALYFSCETGAVLSDSIGKMEQVLLHRIEAAATDDLPESLRPPAGEDAPSGVQLVAYLRAWAKSCPRPLVLIFDEIDALRDDGLRSVLQQLRDGFPRRPERAPHSVILAGLRDVRDYKVASGGELPVREGRLGTSSPFNIKVASTRLASFTEAQVRALLGQHTAATGQRFSEPALARVFYYTEGQPWLTNALASEVIKGLKITGEIIAAHIDRAKENLVLARATHLDSLMARLMEPRVHRIIGPVIAGTLAGGYNSFDDDQRYVHDLGLITIRPPAIANPIYREVIARVLSTSAEANVVVPPRGFVLPDGGLDFDRLLREFMAFWIEHGEVLKEGMPYHEVAPQLVLMAFFQRVVNGGGYIEREYGVGRGRIDLLLRWPLPDGGEQRHAIELKVRTARSGDPLEKGLSQLDGYLDRLGLDTGVLVIFDRRVDAPAIHLRTTLTDVQRAEGHRVQLLRA